MAMVEMRGKQAGPVFPPYYFASRNPPLIFLFASPPPVRNPPLSHDFVRLRNVTTRDDIALYFPSPVYIDMVCLFTSLLWSVYCSLSPPPCTSLFNVPCVPSSLKKFRLFLPNQIRNEWTFDLIGSRYKSKLSGRMIFPLAHAKNKQLWSLSVSGISFGFVPQIDINTAHTHINKQTNISPGVCNVWIGRDISTD